MRKLNKFMLRSGPRWGVGSGKDDPIQGICTNNKAVPTRKQRTHEWDKKRKQREWCRRCFCHFFLLLCGGANYSLNSERDSCSSLHLHPQLQQYEQLSPTPRTTTGGMIDFEPYKLVLNGLSTSEGQTSTLPFQAWDVCKTHNIVTFATNPSNDLRQFVWHVCIAQRL